jgi:hypothetical protein
MRDTSGSSKVQ